MGIKVNELGPVVRVGEGTIVAVDAGEEVLIFVAVNVGVAAAGVEVRVAVGVFVKEGGLVGETVDAGAPVPSFTTN